MLCTTEFLSKGSRIIEFRILGATFFWLELIKGETDTSFLELVVVEVAVLAVDKRVEVVMDNKLELSCAKL